MTVSDTDKKRRRVLAGVTAVVGAAGAGTLGLTFLNSMSPSARALAAGAPVEVDLSTLQPGQRLTKLWRGKPVWIIQRSNSQVDELPELNNRLKDPDSTAKQQPEYAQNLHRSRNPEYLVLIGICTHLGCSPQFRPDRGGELGADWEGGFYCACHGSRFDLAGRVYKNVPAGANLEVPPYYFVNDNTLLIGENGASA